MPPSLKVKRSVIKAHCHEYHNLSIRIFWSIVSNADFRLIRSAAHTRFCSKCSMIVSFKWVIPWDVEYPYQNQNWFSVNMLLFVKNVTRILEMNYFFENTIFCHSMFYYRLKVFRWLKTVNPVIFIDYVDVICTTHFKLYCTLCLK